LRSNSPPEIPKEQLERIEPIVDSLLAQLRQRTGTLPCESASALVYELETEQFVSSEAQPEAGE
jgi:hypothetical protein